MEKEIDRQTEKSSKTGEWWVVEGAGGVGRGTVDQVGVC